MSFVHRPLQFCLTTNNSLLRCVDCVMPRGFCRSRSSLHWRRLLELGRWTNDLGSQCEPGRRSGSQSWCGLPWDIYRWPPFSCHSPRLRRFIVYALFILLHPISFTSFSTKKRHSPCSFCFTLLHSTSFWTKYKRSPCSFCVICFILRG